jgi:hypothetical protein
LRIGCRAERPYLAVLDPDDLIGKYATAVDIDHAAGSHEHRFSENVAGHKRHHGGQHGDQNSTTPAADP